MDKKAESALKGRLNKAEYSLHQLRTLCKKFLDADAAVGQESGLLHMEAARKAADLKEQLRKLITEPEKQEEVRLT